jgi:hypothetical protein
VDAKDRVEGIVEDLGEEAVVALREGKLWSYKPDDTDGWEAWAYKCGEKDCSRQWHKHHLLSGYSIMDGRLTHDIWECDEDGDWDFFDSCYVDDPAYEEWYKEYSEERRQEGWLEYAEYVSEGGEDVLDEYIVASTRKEEWMARLQQVSGGLKFIGAHRRSLAFVQRVAETDPKKLPQEVQDFLCLDENWFVDGLCTFDDLLVNIPVDKVQVTGDFAVVIFEAEFPESPSVIKARKRDVATGHLHRNI